MISANGALEATQEETTVTDARQEITYAQARAAFEAGHKVHLGGQIFLVRPALHGPAESPVFWVTDERTPGDHGFLLYPDGRVEAK